MKKYTPRLHSRIFQENAELTAALYALPDDLARGDLASISDAVKRARQVAASYPHPTTNTAADRALHNLHAVAERVVERGGDLLAAYAAGLRTGLCPARPTDPRAAAHEDLTEALRRSARAGAGWQR